MPELTYVIPVYNGAKFIERALRSIIGQPGDCTKIVIVDDGSTDHTIDIVCKYKEHVTILQQANAGVSAARNHGLEAVATEIVCFVDQDDYVIGPHRQAVEMNWSDDVDAIIGLAAQGNDDAIFLSMKNKYSINSNGVTLLNHFINDNCVQTSTLCWSTTFLRKIGGFDETLSGIEDIELAMRAFLHGARVVISNTPGWVVWHDHGYRKESMRNVNPKLVTSQFLANAKVLSLIEGNSCDDETIRNFLKRCMREGRRFYLNGYPLEASELFSMARARGYMVHQGPRIERTLASAIGTNNVLSARKILSRLKRAL